MTYRKKLIEVALPLEAINKESAREKSIRHGHPSTLHLWWARRPLAACRAVLFASLVDDPSSRPDEFPTEEAQEKERKRLFEIIEQLVKWENVTNKEVLDTAKAEILKSTDGNPPPVLDPFCGGGSIPLEAQRLGLEAHGSDLNPVAVLITKALIEIPPKFANQPPVNPDSRSKTISNPKSKKAKNLESYFGAQGLAEDVRYYGKWMRDEAFKRIGHLYPKVTIPSSPSPFSQGGRRGTGEIEDNSSISHHHNGRRGTRDEMENNSPLSHQNGRGAGGEGNEATVIAWLWARTVKCPNPACGCQMPLVRSFKLSTKKGKEAWVEPVIDNSQKPAVVNFEVKTGKGNPQDGTVSRKGAVCIACETPVTLDYIRSEGKAGRMDAKLMAIVAEGKRGRVYLSPNQEHEEIAAKAEPEWKPETELSTHPQYMATPRYGMTRHCDLFTSRQLVALTTFCDLVSEAREKILADAIAAGISDDNLQLCEEGTGATAYADAVATYLGLGISKLSDASTSLTRWKPSMDQAIATFARQALSMVWDYVESNIFNNAAGDYSTTIKTMVRAINNLVANGVSSVKQIDATTPSNHTKSIIVCTDPPYYDAVPYADLSDFFYVWLRRSIGYINPELFTTLLVPKNQELVADQYRHGNRVKAQNFFEEGLRKVFTQARNIAHFDYPFTVYYAFKQTEVENAPDKDESNCTSIASTGWETMLEGLIQSGFSITGTLPMRTELANRTRSRNSNALASSIVLVCRPRPENAPSTTRRKFVTTATLNL